MTNQEIISICTEYRRRAANNLQTVCKNNNIPEYMDLVDCVMGLAGAGIDDDLLEMAIKAYGLHCRLGGAIDALSGSFELAE